MSATCYECERTLHEGESAWAYDWTVIDLSGGARTEVRYTCDDCAEDDPC